MCCVTEVGSLVLAEDTRVELAQILNQRRFKFWDGGVAIAAELVDACVAVIGGDVSRGVVRQFLVKAKKSGRLDGNGHHDETRRYPSLEIRFAPFDADEYSEQLRRSRPK
jgi:hypothetical protein